MRPQAVVLGFQGAEEEMIARRLLFVCVWCVWAANAHAQTTAGAGAPQDQTVHQHPTPSQTPGWRLVQDGVITGVFNHQGGPRGGEEFFASNWWMGMLLREHGRHEFGVNVMLSLDPWSVGKSGYREIFQVGEELEGKPLVDRQHPHDLFMQLAASWRTALTTTTSLVLAGGPVGEPTLGPVAFMHRPSAAGLVLAPLGHHTFDSTHLSFGVVSAAVERGRWVFEGSIFNAREPDDDRWDIDTGALDSVAGRVWFRPSNELEVQFSTGHLNEPERLIPGDAIRTTSSIALFRRDKAGFAAGTFGYGVNAAHGERRHGLFGEFTIEHDANSFFGRVDVQQVETSTLITGEVPGETTHLDPATVTAVTIGGARRLFTWRGYEAAIGAALTLYGVPDILKPTHHERPVSSQVFLRLRLPAGPMGRMWNMRMSQGHSMTAAHTDHKRP
jgi:hypothetical protein